MKNQIPNPDRFVKAARWPRVAAKTLLPALLLAGLAFPAFAQTWTLTPLWFTNAVGHLANNSGLNRGIAYGSVSNQVFVAQRAAATTGAIDVFDAATGNLLSGAGGVNGSSLGIDQIGMSDDNILYATPLQTAISGSAFVSIYAWTNWNSTPYLAYQSTGSDPVGTAFAGKRVGDTMAVRGSGANTLILLAVSPSCTNFVLLSTTDGVHFTPTVITNVPGLPQTGAPAGGNLAAITFYTNNTFLIQPGSGASSRNVYLVSYPANFASQTGVSGTILGNAAGLAAPSGVGVWSDYSVAGGIMASAQAQSSVGINSVGLFGMTNFPASTTNVASANISSTVANGNSTGSAALGGAGKTNSLFVLESNNGLTAYTISYSAGAVGPSISAQPVGVTGAFPPQTLSVTASGTAPLSYFWQATNTALAGSFTNIPGANSTNFTLLVGVTNYYRVIVSNSVNMATSTVAFMSLATPITNAVVSQLWIAAVGSSPFLDVNNDTRGIAYDTNSHRVIVCSYSSGSTLYLLDGNTGTNIGSMNMTGAGFPGLLGGVDQVGAGDDGVIYAGNLVSGSAFGLYRWPAPDTASTSQLAYTGDPGNGSGDRWGDNLTVRGAGAATQILLASKGVNVSLLTTPDGTNYTAQLITVTNAPSGFAGNGIAFGVGNTFWAKKYLGDLYEVAYDPVAGTGGVIQDYSSTGSAQIPSGMSGVGVDPVNGILAGVNLANHNNDLELFQLTGTSDPPVIFAQSFFPSFNVNGNNNAAITVKYPRVYALDVNNGIVATTYGVPASTPATITTVPGNLTVYTNDPAASFTVGVSGSLPIYFQWRLNGVPIANATNRTYTLAFPPLTAAGSYDVIVHNLGGAQTSAPPAVLTVLVPLQSTTVTQLWTLPAGSRPYLDNNYGARGLAYDTNTATVLVCSTATTNIYVLDAATGADLFQLNTLGLVPGYFTLDQVGVADDGVVYACNLAGSPLSFPTNFAITAWSSVSPGASLSQAYGPGDPGNGSGDRWGDCMAVRGAGTGTEILIGAFNSANVVLFTTTDGSTFTPNLIPVTAAPAGFASLGIAFGPGDTFWADGGDGYNLRQVSFDRGTWTGTIVNSFNNPTQAPSGFTGLGVDVPNNVLSGVCYRDTPSDLQLYLLSGGANPPALFEQAFFGSVNINSQQNSATALRAGKAFGLSVNNGLLALSYQVPPVFPRLPLKISSFGYQTNSVTLTWNSVPGRLYQIQYANVVTGGPWNNVGPVQNSVGPTVTYTDTTASDATRYYRIQDQ